MAKRKSKKKSMTGEVCGLLFDMVAEVFKAMFVVSVWIIRGGVSLLVLLLGQVGRGIRWIAAKNKEESVRLDARRRELWEERWERWTARRSAEEEEVEEVGPAVLPIAEEVEEEEDPEEVEDHKEAARQAKRLTALRNREDKLRAVHSATPEEWERYQTTVAWRSLMWDIEDAERRLEYLERTA